jgi:hypothetical protein
VTVPEKGEIISAQPAGEVPVIFDYAPAMEAAIKIKVRTNWVGSLAGHGTLVNRALKRMFPPVMLILHESSL